MQVLERQLQQMRAQLAALREIGRAISTAWELEATLAATTQRGVDVMGMDACSISLPDDDGERLILEATSGLCRAPVAPEPSTGSKQGGASSWMK